MNMSHDGESYSLEMNTGSGGGVTNFKNQARMCTGFMHVISQFISRIGRLMIYLYFDIVD